MKTISARENYCKFACIMPLRSCSCCLPGSRYETFLLFHSVSQFGLVFGFWFMFMHNPHLVLKKLDPSERCCLMWKIHFHPMQFGSLFFLVPHCGERSFFTILLTRFLGQDFVPCNYRGVASQFCRNSINFHSA